MGQVKQMGLAATSSRHIKSNKHTNEKEKAIRENKAEEC